MLRQQLCVRNDQVAQKCKGGTYKHTDVMMSNEACCGRHSLPACLAQLNSSTIDLHLF